MLPIVYFLWSLMKVLTTSVHRNTANPTNNTAKNEFEILAEIGMCSHLKTRYLMQANANTPQKNRIMMNHIKASDFRNRINVFICFNI